MTIPTYPPGEPERNPMFLEQRVYQGSSGRVYPNPLIESVSDQAVDWQWEAVHLENEFIRLMVLPEIGGRIHVGQDRTNGYDFFYRQNVIKPALVGLLGPWISGGVEFNWAQHHRPSTFMPVEWAIEDLTDGGRTVWCSEHEPMGRMKGMHGVTLRPGRALVELRARLFNRTPEVKTFLWWVNAAVHVHDQYESVFPPDVNYVADHAKRAVSTFPVSRGRYYGIDYGRRRKRDADLRWYRNIPVPTSYMVVGTREDFFGGYDHKAQAGFVHWADHRISPGKKQWTWGNGEFGRAWDRELTDADGPYVELMAGVYTDNQPDFSFLAPYETRTFAHWFYPIQRIGPPRAASPDAALSLTVSEGHARIGVAVTAEHERAVIRLRAAGADQRGPDRVLFTRTLKLSPAQPAVIERVPVKGFSEATLSLTVEAGGRLLASYRPLRPQTAASLSPATEPPAPAETETLEDLYLTGLHLDQYRHATRHPEDYWREALARSPADSRCNTAMGWWRLRRGEFDAAIAHFETAIATLTRLNTNPYDGEPYYGLGLALRYAGEPAQAEEALAKACWNEPWQGPGHFARAQLAAGRGNFDQAIDLLDRVLERDRAQLAARVLRAALLRRVGDAARAAAEIAAVLSADPLDAWAREELRHLQLAVEETATEPLGDPQTVLDVAHDYAAAGLLPEAIELLQRLAPQAAHPMVRYTLGWLLARAGDPQSAATERRRASAETPDRCFPARLEEIDVLESAIAANPADARAPYYLGNLLYDRRRHDEAIALWRGAARLDPHFPTVHRNLGIAAFNVLHRGGQARAAYRRALRADPSDARVLYEYDQLQRLMGEPVQKRLALLERNAELVQARDDLTVELLTLLNGLGRHEQALGILQTRRFHPWEGGEGRVSEQWVKANLGLARRALAQEDPATAISHLRAGLERPHNLGEGKPPLAADNELHYHLALAHRAAGRDRETERWLRRAAAAQGESHAPPGATSYWRARALQALGDEAGGTRLLNELLRYARRRAKQPQRIDYFAASVPSFLVLADDLDRRNRIECRYLESLASAGLGRRRAAVVGLREVLTRDPARCDARWHLDRLRGAQVGKH